MDPSIQPMGKVFVCDVQEELFFSGDILRSRISVLPTKSSNIQFFFITAQSILCSIYCAQFVSQIS
jgi:hypothetical protein